MAGSAGPSFPPGTRSRMVRIWLTVNDWFLCYAHQYVSATANAITRPDPKWIAVDDIVFKQGAGQSPYHPLVPRFLDLLS